MFKAKGNIYAEEWYRTPSVDEPGTYLLIKETHLFNDERTSATTFHIKVGMAYTKACRRAKQQRGIFKHGEVYSKNGAFLGYTEDKVEIREINYFASPSVAEAMEQSYHEIFKERWNKTPSFGEEWFEVDKVFYDLICKYGFNAFDNFLSCAARYLLNTYKRE